MNWLFLSSLTILLVCQSDVSFWLSFCTSLCTNASWYLSASSPLILNIIISSVISLRSARLSVCLSAVFRCSSDFLSACNCFSKVFSFSYLLYFEIYKIVFSFIYFQFVRLCLFCLLPSSSISVCVPLFHSTLLCFLTILFWTCDFLSNFPPLCLPFSLSCLVVHRFVCPWMSSPSCFIFTQILNTWPLLQALPLFLPLCMLFCLFWLSSCLSICLRMLISSFHALFCVSFLTC